MKKSFICSGLGMIFFMLAGCTTHYVMTTKSGQTIVTQGKPQLDNETGMTSYTVQEGNQQEKSAIICNQVEASGIAIKRLAGSEKNRSHH
ncbi:YgdI/YgdR family lipoprotein [Salmonella enterica]|nr:YgdI/YgdR family lipoprotein [Salmonella enterica subsp. enterica serovar Newport]EDX9922961.1 YgdI/YgdR family lipoprotein [Salmonella enterica]EEE8670910.1 YgdI/YgdR family lipoprotein [Salmonella enterica]EHL3531810.1 YgdI/YgdR family lipoprotein [Salmonella enterica]